MVASEANRGLPHAAERTIVNETWARRMLMLMLELEMGRESSRPIELGKRGLSKSPIGPQQRRWRQLDAVRLAIRMKHQFN